MEAVERRVSESGSILDKIAAERPYLQPALRRIADYIINNPHEVKSLQIKKLASSCKVSESTITRFVKIIGVSGFQQLKLMIAEQLSGDRAESDDSPSKTKLIYEDISDADPLQDIIHKVHSRYVKTTEDISRLVNYSQLEAVVAAIERVDVIAFFALGSSVQAADNALMRFMRVGKRCMYFRDSGFQEVSANTLGPNSLAIGISNSGASISVVNSLLRAKQSGAQTVAITSFDDSPLANVADFKLYTSSMGAPTGSAKYRESMVSKVGQIFMIDILYCLYAVKHFPEAVEYLARTDLASQDSRIHESEY